MSAPELSWEELARLDHPEAPESLRERLAAAFALIDQTPRREPLTWEQTQQRWPSNAVFYRALADAAIDICTESALR